MRRRRWVWVGIAGCALGAFSAAPAAFADGEIVPSPAAPFTRVTVNDQGFCPKHDEQATADSEAFLAPITLSRETSVLVGDGDIANVEKGPYSVRISCDSGSTTRFEFRVTALPGAPDAGLGGAVEERDGARLVLVGVLAAAAFGLAVAAARAWRATRGNA